MPPPPIVLPPDPDEAPPVLSPEQLAALEQIRDIDVNGFGVALLDGVTGGGKTEVFFEAVADTLRAGRQALMLLPEIALTHTFLERFTRRFGTRPGRVAFGHDAGAAGPDLARRSIRARSARVVGARSALFLPFHELGLIVLDEEHDGAYKQSDGVNYHARDMAVVRARFADARVILSSATPSVESRNNANTGRYKPCAADIALCRGSDAGHHRARHARGAARERALDRPAAGARDLRDARPRRAGAAVPQPARLCAADAVPGLRASIPVPGLLGLAGRAPLSRRPDVPPLRARAEATHDLLRPAARRTR